MNQRRAKLVMVGISLMVGLALFEGLLRILGVGFPVFVQVDRVTGVAHVPGARGWFTREGRGWVEINDLGLRGPACRETKRQGTLRVALLGDSFTEALQVDDQVSFARVVERRLGETLKTPVEVLNFGVGGFGTAQEYLLLKHRVWQFSPDVIVLAFLTANDVADNHPALRRAPYLPYFQVTEGGLRLDESYLLSDLQRNQASFFTRARRELVRHSHIAQVVSGAAAVVESRRASEGGPVLPGGEIGLDMDVYREPTAQAWREAWDVTERLLVAMRDEARERSVPFYLVVLSNGPQVHPDVARRREIAVELGVADLFYPDRRLARFSEQVGLPALTLASSLADEAEQRRVFFHGFGKALGTGHWNEEGHRAAGERIAAWLARETVARNLQR